MPPEYWILYGKCLALVALLDTIMLASNYFDDKN